MADAACTARMRAFDQLSDAERELANEFGVNALRNVMAGMVRGPGGDFDPIDMRARLEKARRNKPLWRVA